jgi:hypothetical protein
VFAKNVEPGGLKNCEFSSLGGFPTGSCVDTRYSLIKAADGKIPLSVVHVNNKPQHIVFCLHSPHLFSKQRRLLVESPNGLGERGFPEACFAPSPVRKPEPGQIPISSLTLFLPETDGNAQKRCILGVVVCETWRFGTSPPEPWREKPRFPSLPKQRLRRNHLLVQYPCNQHLVGQVDIEHNMLAMLETA